jgi:hypothetical protein
MAPRLRFGFPNMARMPSLLRSVAGLLLLATAVLAVTLTIPRASAQVVGGVSVTIQPPGDADLAPIHTSQVSDAEMDIRDQTYRIAKPAGGFREITVTRGVSLLKLFELAGASFNYATAVVIRRNGTDLVLTRDAIKEIGENFIYADAQGRSYFVGPKQSDGIVAHRDYFLAGAMNITQYAESRLKVKISPSEKKIEPGGTIEFKATVTGEGADDTISYKWWLSGKRPQDGGSTYIQDFPNEDDVYRVSVAVRVAGSTRSETAVATITVGDPDNASEEQIGGGDATAGSGTSTGGSSGVAPTYTPTPAPVAPSTPAPTPDPVEPPDITTSGTPVEGNLLADASDPPPSSLLESAAAAARDGKQKDDSAADGAGVPEAAISIAGVLALLGLGAGIESRQGRLPRPGLPRRAA